jgi:maltooligosyltrehalose trehalohydrolase
MELTFGQKNAPLLKQSDGSFTGEIEGIHPGDRYAYRVGGKGPFPDPASRYQPDGVHGFSQIVDLRSFPWSDGRWTGISLEQLVIYELHVGTFTPAGTFAGAVEKLPYLAQLGVNAIELMPVADFPGQRNWGYDGVDLFAPARCYGTPDDLRALADEAHRLGLAVILDVVYNHLGPDGSCLGRYSPYYFSNRHGTPWGKALNFDGPFSGPVRRFFLENALHWIHEYHIDGLRLDATHAIVDDSPRHFLAEIADAIRASVPGRNVLLIAEDNRNLDKIVKPPGAGGWGLDAVWADDFHHQLRRLLAGDHEGYYKDYTGSTEDLAETIRHGWFYRGQYSLSQNTQRGTDSSGIASQHFVYFLQNHDQVGNRAFGERLNRQIDPAAYRAASALLLCAPATPLLFMGQEWAASTPFLFFTDHKKDLGDKVREGRRQEFKQFSAFAHPDARRRIPDPQAIETFLASRLDWQEIERQPHASVLRLYQALLDLRRREPAFRADSAAHFDVAALGAGALCLRRMSPGHAAVLIIVQLKQAETIDLARHPLTRDFLSTPWNIILTTEDPQFCSDPARPEIQVSDGGALIQFRRPSAALLRER